MFKIDISIFDNLVSVIFVNFKIMIFLLENEVIVWENIGLVYVIVWVSLCFVIGFKV